MKARTAALSVASNSTLIVLKVIAGTITGSVAILTEAVHSSIDLIASIVAFFSVRKADEPADESHRYGHEKIENLAAAIEGILILVGSSVIAFEAIRRLLRGGQVQYVPLGIAVVAISVVANLIVSAVIARRARTTESAALAGDAAHLRTDALTSAGVLIGLALVQLTGAQWIDPAVALAVAASIVVTGVRLVGRSSRVLVDEALPGEEVGEIRNAIEEFGSRGVVGYHELRTRRAGARRYVDLHVQFRSGTSLEDAHRTAHELQDVISSRLAGTDVLIHLEPADRVRPGEDLEHEVPRRDDPVHASEDRAGAASEDRAGAASEDRAGAASEDRAGAASEDRAGAASEDRAGAASEDRAGAASEDPAGAASEDRAGAASEDRAGTASEDRAGTASEDRAGAAPQDRPGRSQNR